MTIGRRSQRRGCARSPSVKSVREERRLNIDFRQAPAGARTGVEVTELGLGTAPLGETFDVIEEDEARALLAAAWDGGVRYFDTSPWYGKGQAEHRLGRALYRRPREEYVISSKVGRVLRRPLEAGPVPARFRLDRRPRIRA